MTQKQLCNMCGCSLIIHDTNAIGVCGTRNITFDGVYESRVLLDMTRYVFSLCEYCVEHMFSNFVIPPELFDQYYTTEEEKFNYIPHQERVACRSRNMSHMSHDTAIHETFKRAMARDNRKQRSKHYIDFCSTRKEVTHYLFESEQYTSIAEEQQFLQNLDKLDPLFEELTDEERNSIINYILKTYNTTSFCGFKNLYLNMLKTRISTGNYPTPVKDVNPLYRIYDLYNVTLFSLTCRGVSDDEFQSSFALLQAAFNNLPEDCHQHTKEILLFIHTHKK